MNPRILSQYLIVGHEQENHQLRSMMMAITFLCSSMFYGETATASNLRTYPIRDLTRMADIVVVARPVPHIGTDGKSASFSVSKSFLFVVKQVVQGRGLRPGQPFQLSNDGYHEWNGIRPISNHYLEEKDRAGAPEIQEVLLFLAKDMNNADSDADYRLLHSGIRLLTSDGRTLVPMQFSTIGGFEFIETRNLQSNWGDPYWDHSHLADDFQNIVATLISRRRTFDLLHALRCSGNFRPSNWLDADMDLRPLSFALTDVEDRDTSNPQEDLLPVQPQTDQP